MANILDPDQARHFVRPDLGPNCLQRLSADNMSPLAEKKFIYRSCFCFIGTTIPQQAPRPMPRSRSTSGALTVSLPPQPPQRHSMAPTTLSLNQQPPTVSRSFSVPASMVPSPSTPKQPMFPKQPMSMPGTPSSINENPVADNESNECNVCYERPVNAVLYTCGHMCMCFECAQAVRRERSALCPICRQEIKDVIKIYRS